MELIEPAEPAKPRRFRSARLIILKIAAVSVLGCVGYVALPALLDTRPGEEVIRDPEVAPHLQALGVDAGDAEDGYLPPALGKQAAVTADAVAHGHVLRTEIDRGWKLRDDALAALTTAGTGRLGMIAAHCTPDGVHRTAMVSEAQPGLLMAELRKAGALDAGFSILRPWQIRRHTGVKEAQDRSVTVSAQPLSFLHLPRLTTNIEAPDRQLELAQAFPLVFGLECTEAPPGHSTTDVAASVLGAGFRQWTDEAVGLPKTVPSAFAALEAGSAVRSHVPEDGPVLQVAWAAKPDSSQEAVQQAFDSLVGAIGSLARSQSRSVVHEDGEVHQHATFRTSDGRVSLATSTAPRTVRMLLTFAAAKTSEVKLRTAPAPAPR